MISETRAKVISWLRSPKSIASKTGLAIAVVGVISVGTASAFALTSSNKEPEAPQSSIIAADEETKKAESSISDIEETSPKEEEFASTTSQSPDSSASTQQTTTGTNDTPPPAAEPEVPATPIYVDTYPAALKSAPISSKLDQWGLDNRQSTSYTAWKVNEAFGNMPKWGYTGNGNASNWPSLADSANIERGPEARLHSVGVVGNFTAWVEAVSDDKVTVSFYNWGNTGEFGTWENVPASKFTTYIYFK